MHTYGIHNANVSVVHSKIQSDCGELRQYWIPYVTDMAVNANAATSLTALIPTALCIVWLHLATNGSDTPLHLPPQERYLSSLFLSNKESTSYCDHTMPLSPLLPRNLLVPTNPTPFLCKEYKPSYVEFVDKITLPVLADRRRVFCRSDDGWWRHKTSLSFHSLVSWRWWMRWYECSTRHLWSTFFKNPSIH